MEILAHRRWIAPPPLQVASHRSDERRLRSRTLPPDGIALHVVVQHLVRIQVRTVGRQQEQFESLRVFLQPAPDRPAPVRGMAVHDQKHFPPPLPEEPPREGQENAAREFSDRKSVV